MKQRTKTKVANAVVLLAGGLFLLGCLVGLIFLSTVSWASALAVAAVIGLIFLVNWVSEHAEL